MRELYILLSIFLVLSFGMHYEEFFSYPLEHTKNLSTSGAFGLGFLHPFIFTLALYFLMWIPRSILIIIRKKTRL